MTLIKREDAIDAICKEWCYVTYGNCPHVDDGFVCDGCDDVKALNALPSAEAEWIPVSERLPDELAAVNITWVNHNPPPYYKYTKDVPLVDSAVYYRGKWYWWDATVIDLLGEYDGAYIHGIEPIDKDIEVVAWMPLPKPYREENEE